MIGYVRVWNQQIHGGNILAPLGGKWMNNISSSNHNVLAALGDKITTPEEALASVSSGDRIFVGTACATPRVLVQTLENMGNRLTDVHLYHFLVDGAIPCVDGRPTDEISSQGILRRE